MPRVSRRSRSFAAGVAEAIPLGDRSVDLITAAGSLNYVDLDVLLPEAARVLMPDGVLVVYDFSAGRSFRPQPRWTRGSRVFSALSAAGE